MTKRPRTEIELRFLSDCVYSAIVEYGQSKLPLCKYTLAHLYFSEFHGRVEDHVNQFPQHFGYLRDFLNRKNFNRFIGHVKSLADDKDVLNSLKESYRNTQIRFSHENSSPLVEGIPCNVCFNTPTTNIVDDIKSRCKKLLTDFSNKELACGNNFKEIHECICETSFQILSSYDKSIENFKNSFDELKVEFQRYKLELTDNLAKFDDHLKEVSAVIHYGSGLSGSGVQHLDRTIFCREFTKKDIEQHLSNLPDYRHIKSSDPNVEFGDLFHEYCSHVLTHLCEPSFFKLGQKYSLTGIKGGSSAARLSEHAQSICLNYLLFPCNHGIYSELRPILAVHSNARTRYTPHPLVDGLSIPRLPSVSEADEKVEILRELQSILLGTPQIPVHYEGWDLVKSCPKQVAANSRLVDLMSIRKHSLSFQSDNKFLKAKSTEHYQNLSIDEVKSTLKIYSLICESDFQKYDENFLRKKLQEAESTRSFAMWYDHAVILNRSYILFVVWPLFSKSVYQSKDLIEGDLQKAVEQIYVHYIAMSPSTTNSEEALQEFRTEQLASFKVKIQGESGIEFTDRLKFVNGDAPVRCVENGSNKSGPYRNPTLLQSFPIDQCEYYQILKFEHMTFEKTTKHANKGGFFEKPENRGKSLQEMKDHPASALDLLKIRWPHKRHDKMNSQQIKEFLQNDLGGIRRPPILFMASPEKSAEEIGLKGAELLGNECLHGLRGETIKSFKHIPGPQGDGPLKVIHDIISNCSNYDYGSKHEKSGESVFKNLIEIVQKLELKLFPDGLSCNNCGDIFTLSTVTKCPKCLYYSYFRALLEIHIFGYKDESKRSGASALLLHNIIFVWFKTLKEIQTTIPNALKVINSIYFLGIVYYMGPTFELTNFLSVHAGRMEDIFRQLKVYAHSFTNRKHFQESFLLNVIKRHEISRYFKTASNFKTHRSTVSSAITAFHQRSPIPDIVLTKEFITSNAPDFAGHLCRISNFVVSNINAQFLSLSPENDLKFLSPRECCSDNCRSSCPPCLSKLFPDFPIHNILTSSIDIILDTKADIFQKFACNIFVNGEVNFSNLRKLLGQDPALDIITLSSSEIILNVNIDRENPSRLKLQANFSSMLQSLIKIFPSHPERFDKLKHSNMAKCISKILNSVPDEIIHLDSSSRRLGLVSSSCVKDPNKSGNNDRQHKELAYYTSRIKDSIELISTKLLSYQKDIDKLSGAVDKLITNRQSTDSIEDNQFVKKLRGKQKLKLIALEVLNKLTYEINTHNYFLYRPL